MKLKNTSEKVISIGSSVVMPDGVITIAKERAEAPAIKALIKQGFVSVENESSAAGKEQETVDVPPAADDSNPAGTSTNNTKPPAETDASANKKNKK